MIEFGNTDLPYTNVYPNEATLKKLVRTEIIKLQRIRYQTTSVGNLAGIQMEFANLTGSPLFCPHYLMRFEGRTVAARPFKTIEIDTSRRIQHISMKVLKNEKQSCIGGLRFIDEHGDFIVDRNFWADSASDYKLLSDQTEIKSNYTWE